MNVLNPNTTLWQLEPSLKFDTLCFLNTLSGDPFYARYYQDELKKFENKIPASAQQVFSRLKQKIKDENGGIISAFLCLYFSATDDTTLEDLLVTIADSRPMQARLKRTPYYDETSWKLYEAIQGDLSSAVQFLKNTGFDTYWRENIKPAAEKKIAEIEAEFSQYNIVPAVEQYLGFSLPSNEITVYMLYYTQPHGIKITGTRFITDVAWPFKIVLRNAIHELMHPPYDLAQDEKLKTALSSLRADAFLMDKIQNHNPSFGYNSFEGFIEENCVQAIEQLTNEKFKIAREAGLRWKENDDGMHVFAAALYQTLQDECYTGLNETFAEFLTRVIASGKLSAGKIEAVYNEFYQGLSAGLERG